ncbi:MAG TPA: hypothetical protein DCZ92_12605 [Elusimicrobia bacterium]|nr:MAG: hypothetical protein A2016_02535 [Elusimicrobia bacterium GWF2_62_30]HBA61628.1 hypothetical protein [Elusimicrobiota bacterium]
MEKRERSVISGDIKSILKNVSRTLYLSLNILPEPARSLMGLGYLLCRAADTVTDTPGMSLSDKTTILSLMRGLDTPGNAARLEERVKKYAMLASDGERELLLKFGKILSLYEKISPEEKELFSELLAGVITGMELDLKSFTSGATQAFATAADLERYCSLVGGAPGVFWARLYRQVIRRSSPAAANFPSVEDAEMIGAALQMTNILQDLAGDLRIGRCYLPQSDLDEKNLKPADLLDPANMSRLRDIVSKWSGWALDRLDLCESFLLAVPKTELALRAAVIWPVYWAMDTLEEVAHSNLLDPETRPRIKRSRVYTTIAATPPLLLSNTAFARGYRFRRETLIGSLTGGDYEGRAL